jgi:hypothetical protein
LIRKRNRRLFVASAILLGLGSAMFWAHPSGIWSWRGFFLGPRLITGQELASREFSPSRAGWVAVAASNSTDTGVEIYHTYSDGQKFLAGHYLRAEVDGHPLVIHVDSRDAHSPFRGTFKPIDGPLKSQLSDHGYASAGDGATASFYLDTIGQETLDGYRQDGFDTLKICVWFLLFGFPALWLAVRRTLNKRQHPFARELAKRGSLAANVQQIDTEVANGGKTFNRLRVTSNWLILEKYWAPVPMRMSDVVRVYYKRDSTGPACFVHDRLGTVIQASMGSKMAHDAQKKIAAMAPQASRD